MIHADNRDALREMKGESIDACVCDLFMWVVDSHMEEALGLALHCYDGAMEDCDSAVEVLIRRIKGDASLESAGEWVKLNYPALARQHGLLPPRPLKAPSDGGDNG